MRNRRKLLFAIGCTAAVAALLGLLLLGGRQQLYHGRSVSEWFELYCESERAGDTPQSEVAAAAVKATATNALPLLVRYIQYETPSWVRPAGRLPAPIAKGVLGSSPTRVTVAGKSERAEFALTLLLQLGTNAVGILPELTTLIHDRNRPETARRAIYALSRMGPEGFQTLVSALGATNQPFREMVLNFIAIGSAPVVGTNMCLPAIRAALHDPDPIVRITATNMLAWLTKQQQPTPATQ